MKDRSVGAPLLGPLALIGLAVVAVALFACSRDKEGTILDVSYRVQLDGSYRRADVASDHHEDVWYSDREDAPIVSIHVTNASVTAGQSPRCLKSGGVGWSQGLVFYPDSPDRLRNGNSADMAFCSERHPELSIACSVYFRSGELDQSRAGEVLAPCRTLTLR